MLSATQGWTLRHLTALPPIKADGANDPDM